MGNCFGSTKRVLAGFDEVYLRIMNEYMYIDCIQ